MDTKSIVYVVTRDGRRTEEQNYSTHAQAKARAEALKVVLAEWDPSGVSSINIVKTDKPKRIR
jgi:hypothetical protein